MAILIIKKLFQLICFSLSPPPSVISTDLIKEINKGLSFDLDSTPSLSVMKRFIFCTFGVSNNPFKWIHRHDQHSRSNWGQFNTCSLVYFMWSREKKGTSVLFSGVTHIHIGLLQPKQEQQTWSCMEGQLTHSLDSFVFWYFGIAHVGKVKFLRFTHFLIRNCHNTHLRFISFHFLFDQGENPYTHAPTIICYYSYRIIFYEYRLYIA